MVSKKTTDKINRLKGISLEQKEALHLLSEPRTAAGIAAEIKMSYQAVAGWLMIWRENKWVKKYDVASRQVRWILNEEGFNGDKKEG